MLPAPEICERARLSRDPRFDGWFFVGVLTTGIYCRPVCPARLPGAANVRFFASAAAAQDAGFRPCLRCRPERASNRPEWGIRSPIVVRALRLIERGALDESGVEALSRQLGVSGRHLDRVFRQTLGATPKRVAVARRRHLAKRLIDDTSLPFATLALQVGYRSLRRFNDDLRAVYGRSPTELRRAAQGAGRRPRVRDAAAPGAQDGFSLRLAVRQPYDAAAMFAFLGRRALAGFESVDGLQYRRRVFDAGGLSSWISVTWDGSGLVLRVPAGAAIDLADVLIRVRRVFDVDADAVIIDGHLRNDPLLAPIIARQGGGLRVPGAWAGFETAVRAVLGQQVSVARATLLAQRLLERYGERALMAPTILAAADPAELGMPGRRGAAIAALAAAAAAGELALHEGADTSQLTRQLCAVPGIGPWTAGYVAMRVARDPDAFPDNDWVVNRMLALTPAVARRRAEDWRPWRAYAVMYLWQGAAHQQARGQKASGPDSGEG
jgi:AraC family transcriptional regulator of adaptative response / DNA-3-methyladenine glycosylase II